MSLKKNNKKNTPPPSVKKNNSDLFFFKPLFVFVIISIITIFIYSGITKNEIVQLDDDVIIDNLKTLHQNSYHILNEAFSRDAMVGVGGDLYRPVQTFSLILFYSMGKGSLVYFHVFQILLHILACFLFFTLMTSFLFDKKKSLILTLIYTTHPLFASLVSFIPAIGDQLLVIWGICSFICLINYLKTNRYIFLIAHIITFFLAVFTKETALVFPAIFLFYYFIIYKSKRHNILILPLIFWILLPLTFLFLRQKYVLPDMVATHNILNFKNVSHNFLYNIPSFFEYITKFFIPYKLSFLASYSSFRTVIGILIFCIFIALSVFKKIDFKWLVFCFLWYGIFILPPMLYRNPVFDYGEHRGFLPLISILLLLASIKNDKVLNWLFCAFIPIFTFMSFDRKNDFKDPLTFYNSIIENDPTVPIAFLNRGAYIHKYKNDIKAVYNDYNKAIELKSDYSTALYNRAILKSEVMKDYDGAFTDLEAAIKAKPNYADAFYHRGYLKLTHNNDLKNAKNDIDSAIILNPSYVLAYNNRGIMELSYVKDSTAALNDFNKSITLQPQNNPVPFFNRGLYFFKTNDIKRACQDWDVAQKQGYSQAENFIKNYCIK